MILDLLSTGNLNERNDNYLRDCHVDLLKELCCDLGMSYTIYRDVYIEDYNAYMLIIETNKLLGAFSESLNELNVILTLQDEYKLFYRKITQLNLNDMLHKHMNLHEEYRP